MRRPGQRVPSCRSDGAPIRRSLMLNAVSRPYLVTCRTTSWLLSTHVGVAPTRACGIQRGVDHLAQRGSLPRAAQEVEIEHRVQLVRAQVAGQPLMVRSSQIRRSVPGRE